MLRPKFFCKIQKFTLFRSVFKRCSLQVMLIRTKYCQLPAPKIRSSDDPINSYFYYVYITSNLMESTIIVQHCYTASAFLTRMRALIG